jgi:glutamate-1-semialdehyde 2,1-aminomutase
MSEHDGGRSGDWLARARAALPGGVSSPARAFDGVAGTPPVIRSGRGAIVTDVDGRDFLDFVGSSGALILGHAHPQIVAAIEAAARRGTSFGASSPPEIELAERIGAAYPGIEQVRFVSSGAGAIASAVRLARGATGRELVVKFAGCYHGSIDYLLVSTLSGRATFANPWSAGVPAGYAAATRVLPLDDEERAAALFAIEDRRIAAVVIEPAPANNGLLLQRREFLAHLRELCNRHGALLIFDELTTGFRLGAGGAAEHYGVTPDLATFGSVIGAGLPAGALGGPREIMRQLAPEGDVYQADAQAGNPIALAAGLETLRVLEQESGWRRLASLGEHLGRQVGAALAESPVPATLCRLGSIFWITWLARSEPRSTTAIDARSAEIYAHVFHSLRARGIALAPSAFEVSFLSLAHTPADIDRLAESLLEALREIPRRSANRG